jgi:hypothetical protein
MEDLLCPGSGKENVCERTNGIVELANIAQDMAWMGS